RFSLLTIVFWFEFDFLLEELKALKQKAPTRGPFLCAPSMGALLWVKVPSRVDHSERSEAQLHEGDRVWGGSVERSCGPMNKNRIEGVADQGERAINREALVIKGKRRRSGGRAVKECVLTWGDLASCPKGRRCRAGARSQPRPSWAGGRRQSCPAGEGPNERR